MSTRSIVPVTIPNNGTISTPANTQGFQRVLGVYIPALFTSTILTFLASRADGSGTALVGDGAGASYTKTCRAGDYIPLPQDIFAGIDQLQIIGGTSETPARKLLVVVG